jgi:hypothetical protein
MSLLKVRDVAFTKWIHQNRFVVGEERDLMPEALVAHLLSLAVRHKFLQGTSSYRKSHKFLSLARRIQTNAQRQEHITTNKFSLMHSARYSLSLDYISFVHASRRLPMGNQQSGCEK